MPNPGGDTPTRAKKTHTANYESAHVDDARATVTSDIPEVPEVTLDSTLGAFFILNSGYLEPACEILISNRSIKNWNRNPRWKWLRRDPKNVQPHENIVFNCFGEIWEAVRAVAPPELKGSCMNCMIDGNGTPFSSRNNQSRPDGFLYEGQKQNAPNQVGWAAIVQSMEFKKRRDKSAKIDDYAKATWSMHHVMRNDARRRFVFGLTCENTTARLWYNDRCDIVASEEFDINKDWKILVHIFLSMLQATPDRLGYDPDMELRPSLSPTAEPEYDITIHNKDTGKTTIYRTREMISDAGTNSPVGSGTRVWSVNELEEGAKSADTYVLKDTWIPEDRTPEYTIVKNIREAQPVFSQHFLTIRDYGFGSFSFAQDDNTHGTLRRKNLEPTNNVLAIRSCTTRGRSQKDQGTPRGPVGYLRHPPGPHPKGIRDFRHLSEHPLKHCRIVFVETGTPVHKLKDFNDIFTAVGGGLKGTHSVEPSQPPLILFRFIV
ncbi:unnamed protein product [Rhizoctonia solani]|uniref:Fungal-type protein kinase domain-containing protein n=1 Tax=Rhizoctonia solani TaxID=456999 RepID=A0A8H3HQ81_9AGAM|nr:unnamed protein product [Rhizoctonia solani]